MFFSFIRVKLDGLDLQHTLAGPPRRQLPLRAPADAPHCGPPTRVAALQSRVQELTAELERLRVQNAELQRRILTFDNIVDDSHMSYETGTACHWRVPIWRECLAVTGLRSIADFAALVDACENSHKTVLLFLFQGR